MSRVSFPNPFVASHTLQLILQPFRRFTYVTAHSTTLPLLRLRHRHFIYIASLFLQLFRLFTYVTTHSTTLPLLHLRHSSFYSTSVVSPTSQALHLRHLASRPCQQLFKGYCYCGVLLLKFRYEIIKISGPAINFQEV